MVDVFRESQENGLVKLLLAGIGVGVGVGPGNICGCGAVGGGPHGTEGRTPDKPCREGLEFLAGRGGLVFSGTRLIRFRRFWGRGGYMEHTFGSSVSCWLLVFF